jgi:hypothetical protein
MTNVVAQGVVDVTIEGRNAEVDPATVPHHEALAPLIAGGKPIAKRLLGPAHFRSGF